MLLGIFSKSRFRLPRVGLDKSDTLTWVGQGGSCPRARGLQCFGEALVFCVVFFLLFQNLPISSGLSGSSFYWVLKADFTWPFQICICVSVWWMGDRGLGRNTHFKWQCDQEGLQHGALKRNMWVVSVRVLAKHMPAPGFEEDTEKAFSLLQHPEAGEGWMLGFSNAPLVLFGVCDKG